MSFNATYFLSPATFARVGGGLPDVLHLYPDGEYVGAVNLQFPNRMSAADRVKVAEALLRTMQEFRDAVVVNAEAQRTATDELAEAHAEIARLKGQAGEEA